jgi:hypothetical protein
MPRKPDDFPLTLSAQTKFAVLNATGDWGVGSISDLIALLGNTFAPLPVVTSGLALGTYVDNRSNAGQDFVNFIGVTPAGFFAESHGPGTTATGNDALNGSSGGWGYTLGVNSWYGTGKIQNTQMPMLPKDGSYTLAQSASGALDAVYTGAANAILTWFAANNPTQTKIIIRPGQEMNANFAGGGNTVLPAWCWQIVRNGAVDATIAGQYATTFQRIVTQFRNAATAAGKPGIFEFTFSTNIGGYDWAAAWPGDSYINYFGMDAYYGLDGYGNQPYRYDGYEIFEHMRTIPYGLQAAKDFATAHGKPFRMDEFGVSRNDLPSLVTAATTWAKANAVAFSWWDSDGAYASRVSNGNLPAIGSALRAAFNSGQYPSPQTVTVGTNLITQAITNPLTAPWRTNGQDLIVTPNYGTAPDGTTPTVRIRSASGAANLEAVLTHSSGRQFMNLRALTACTLTQFSPERGGEKVFLKVGEARQIIKSLGGDVQFNLYSEDGPFDVEIWGAGVCTP